MMNPPGHYERAAWGSQQSVASPANFSPPLPPSSGYAPAPGYSDGDVHDCFNPNITFPHGAPQRSSPSGFNPGPRTPSPVFNAGLNTRHIDADMDEIITSGFVAATSFPGFGVQDEATDTAVDMDDELGNAEEEEGEE
ncbi:Malonyl-coenzymeanthocyanin 3-O-glucoside-6''-O-malonyltransferase [Hordeum vulgare]|nr:Malonyl-coenzymeanthocyanin 3-O-glucoside-6''-O-malonyltransferase [Hordeum vulgare]